jgi:hypothetical protein
MTVALNFISKRAVFTCLNEKFGGGSVRGDAKLQEHAPDECEVSFRAVLHIRVAYKERTPTVTSSRHDTK